MNIRKIIREELQKIIKELERTSYKEYEVGDIINGDMLDDLSGNLVGNDPNNNYQLIQKNLSDFDYTRQDLIDLDPDYADEEIWRLESMKDNFKETPPIPEDGDGMHRIIAAKELGYKTILMWKKISEDIKEGYDDVSIDFIKNKQKRWDYDNFSNKKEVGDFTYLNFVKDDNWYLWGNIIVFDNNDGTEVANSSYGKTTEYSPIKSTIDVRPDKRRMGIASNVYKWIEELTGDVLHPDTPHSKSAEKLWAQPNREFGNKKK